MCLQVVTKKKNLSSFPLRDYLPSVIFVKACRIVIRTLPTSNCILCSDHVAVTLVIGIAIIHSTTIPSDLEMHALAISIATLHHKTSAEMSHQFLWNSFTLLKAETVKINRCHSSEAENIKTNLSNLLLILHGSVANSYCVLGTGHLFTATANKYM